MRIINELSEWYTAINQLFPGRQEIIDLALCCLVAEQNMMIIGLPGYGKTKVLEAVVDSISNTNVFHYQFHRASRREDVVGMVDAPHYIATGESRILTDGFLPTAEYAVLDEFLRSNPATANSILSIIHPFEHIFKNGNQVVHCPLRTCFATANYMSMEDAEEMEAIYERFACIVYVSTHLSQEDELTIYNTYREPFTETIPVNTLYKLTSKMRKVKVLDDELLYLRKARLKACDIRNQSPRTACFALELAKAYATLQGETMLVTEHLDFTIPHVFSREAKDFSQITSLLVSMQ